MSAVSADDPTDPDLLRHFATEGDERAFARLVERHGGLVFSTALRRSGSRELAQEAAQNVFAALARKAARLEAQARAQGSLASWLHRAAVLEAAALARREARHHHAMRRHQHDPSHQPASLEADAAWQQVRAVVDDALASLATADRRLLLLHHVEGRTFPEIASASGQSEASVQRRTHRALQRLADRLRRRGVAVPALALGGALASGFTGEAAAAPVAAPALAAAALAQAKTASASTLGAMLHTWLASPAALAAVFLLSAAAPAGWRWAHRTDSASATMLAAQPAAEPAQTSHPEGLEQEITPETRLNFLRQALAQLSRTSPDEAPTPLGLQLRRYMLGLSAEELRPVAEVLTASETQHLEILTVIEAFNARLAELEPRTALMLVQQKLLEPGDDSLRQVYDKNRHTNGRAVIDILGRRDFAGFLESVKTDPNFFFSHWLSLTQINGQTTLEYLQKNFLEDSRQENHARACFDAWLDARPNEAMVWLDQNLDSYAQLAGSYHINQVGHRLSASQAVALVSLMQDPLLRSVLIESAWTYHRDSHPEAFTTLAPLLRLDDGGQPLSVRDFVWTWRKKDAAGADAWVAALPEGDLKAAAERSLEKPNPFDSPAPQ